jgi:hypothetical protein
MRKKIGTGTTLTNQGFIFSSGTLLFSFITAEIQNRNTFCKFLHLYTYSIYPLKQSVTSKTLMLIITFFTKKNPVLYGIFLVFYF